MREWVLDPAAFDLARAAPALIDTLLAGLRVCAARRWTSTCDPGESARRSRVTARRGVRRRGIMRPSAIPWGPAHEGISKVGVIGAGTMGNGIAQTCAVAGFDVVMVDVAEAAVRAASRRSPASLERLVKKEKLTADAKAQALARVTGTTDYGALAGVRPRHRGRDGERRAQAQDPA